MMTQREFIEAILDAAGYRPYMVGSVGIYYSRRKPTIGDRRLITPEYDLPLVRNDGVLEML